MQIAIGTAPALRDVHILCIGVGRGGEGELEQNPLNNLGLIHWVQKGCGIVTPIKVHDHSYLHDNYIC